MRVSFAFTFSYLALDNNENQKEFAASEISFLLLWANIWSLGFILGTFIHFFFTFMRAYLFYKKY